MSERIYSTNYSTAVHWLHNNLVLCNELYDLDASLVENARFSWHDEEEDSYTEIFQWFITDCSDFDVEFLEEHFGLKFTYSDKLYKWILCVDHYGTGWDYVHCYTDLQNAERKED